MVGGPTGRIFSALLLGPLLSLAGGRKVGLMLWWKPFKKEDVATVLDLVETGKLTPVIDRTYPLSDVVAALRYMDEGHARGKVLIAT